MSILFNSPSTGQGSFIASCFGSVVRKWLHELSVTFSYKYRHLNFLPILISSVVFRLRKTTLHPFPLPWNYVNWSWGQNCWRLIALCQPGISIETFDLLLVHQESLLGSYGLRTEHERDRSFFVSNTWQCWFILYHGYLVLEEWSWIDKSTDLLLIWNLDRCKVLLWYLYRNFNSSSSQTKTFPWYLGFT